MQEMSLFFRDAHSNTYGGNVIAVIYFKTPAKYQLKQIWQNVNNCPIYMMGSWSLLWYFFHCPVYLKIFVIPSFKKIFANQSLIQ